MTQSPSPRALPSCSCASLRVCCARATLASRSHLVPAAYIGPDSSASSSIDDETFPAVESGSDFAMRAASGSLAQGCVQVHVSGDGEVFEDSVTLVQVSGPAPVDFNAIAADGPVQLWATPSVMLPAMPAGTPSVVVLSQSAESEISLRNLHARLSLASMAAVGLAGGYRLVLQAGPGQLTMLVL